mmetsp:Transcript_5693/g.13833  ORF Transcript_5693/g.13833 Transcript_5693/m.13833 type:complete len:151 (-) Transcript_5693:92-544(-)
MGMDASVAHVVLRLVTSLSAAMYTMSAVLNVFEPHVFTQGVVAFYMIAAGLCVVVTEFSPFGLDKLMRAFPFLGGYCGRGVSYIMLGTLSLGREMGTLGQVAGSFMIISGILAVLMHFVGDSYGLHYRDPARSGDFRRYEDNLVSGEPMF